MTATCERILSVGKKIELRAGDVAPEIDAETATGEHFRLSALRGTWVVAYFYPRANTPG